MTRKHHERSKGGINQTDLTPAQLKTLEASRTHILSNIFLGEMIDPGLLDNLFPVIGTTHWETLTCVGFNPDNSQLEAVVHINQASGYSGGLCTHGSTEYVRFFIDWHDGNGFQDVGLTSFKAYDISEAPPGPQHPISHMVYLTLDDSTYRKCCDTNNLPTVRAILAWNQIPSLDPDFIPYYGNRVDADIQLKPSLALACVLKEGLLQLDKAKIPQVLDTEVDIKLEKIQPVDVAELLEKYRKADVPDHRTTYDVIAPMFFQQSTASLSQFNLEALKQLDVDFKNVIEQLSKAEANTTYEDLVCVGLNTLTDTFGAVIHVKRPFGYSGNLCQTGSKEYVAFWADWNNNGTFDEYLGTANVSVHDIDNIPADGLYYAVDLPVNMIERLKDCKNPNIVRIRAVLSWSVPPSTTNPNQLNTWGNRLDVVVRLRTSTHAGQGLYDLIYYVGNVPVENIDPVTHFANPSGGVLNPANCSLAPMDRPFAKSVSIRGRIYNTGAPGTVYYQVQYAPHGTGNWLPVTHDVKYRMGHPNPADPLYPFEDRIVHSTDGWFPYQENFTVSPPILETNALLASWSTNSIDYGHYDLRLVYTTDHPTLNPANMHYSDIVTIVIDNVNYNVSPTPNSEIDNAYTLDIVIDHGDCHSYVQGHVIKGHLRAMDRHFWRWTLDLQPSTHTHGVTASPSCRSYGSLIDQGDPNKEWEIDTDQGGTKKLDQCGYTLTLRAYDRAIVNSNGAVVHHNNKAVGFSIT